MAARQAKELAIDTHDTRMLPSGEQAQARRVADDHREQRDQRHRWLMLMAVMAGVVSAVMASSIFNVAIPDISRAFSVGQDQAQWVASGFMAANTASMLTTPWMLTRFGYRHVCQGCMAVLLTGALLGGLATHFPLLLLARVVQGLAAGIMMPIGSIIILRAFAPHEQGRVTAIYSAGVIVVPAIAPILGGMLLETMGWRAIFFMALPFCLLSMWLAGRHIANTAPGGMAAGRNGAFTLDLVGLMLATLGTVCMLNGMVSLGGQPGTQATPLLLGASAALAAFLAWQVHLKRRLTQHDGTLGTRPLIDLGLLRHRQFAMGCLVACTYGAAMYGSVYLLPIYLQAAIGLTPTQAGLVMSPSSLLLAASVTLAGRYADRQAPYRMVSGGLLAMAASFALMALVDAGTSLYAIIAFTIPARLGLGMVLPSLSLGSMRALPKEAISYASSSLSFLQMVGGSIGISLSGVALQWRLTVHGVQLAAASDASLRLTAFNDVFLMLAGLCLVATAAAWGLRPFARAQADPPASAP